MAYQVWLPVVHTLNWFVCYSLFCCCSRNENTEAQIQIRSYLNQIWFLIWSKSLNWMRLNFSLDLFTEGSTDLFTEGSIDLFTEGSTWTFRCFCCFLDRNPVTSLFLSSSPVVFQACIGGYWASSVVCSCPLCKRQFDERPQLSVNKVFALIADKYKLTHYGAAGLPTPVRNGTPASMGAMMTPTNRVSTNPFLTADALASGDEVVWCDICTGVKQPAVRSCLTCTASYCTEHVQPHETSSFYSKHPLMDPQEALRGRTCSIHHRLLEVRWNTNLQYCVALISILHPTGRQQCLILLA